MADSEELWQEINEKRQRNIYLTLKRLLWLTAGIKLRAMKRQILNRCTKCGLRLIYYKTHDDRKIKVCEYCDRVNPENIVTEQDILPGGIIVNKKVYVTGLNKYVYVVIAILIFVLLNWSVHINRENTERRRRYYKMQQQQRQQYILPAHERSGSQD